MTLKKRHESSLEFVKNKINDYLICLKSDGVRFLMLLLGNGKILMVDWKNQFFEVKMDISKLNFYSKFNQEDSRIITIFDGELILDLKKHN